jgi:hypothetical protein
MYSAMEQKKKDKKSVEVEAATHCRPFLSSPLLSHLYHSRDYHPPLPLSLHTFIYQCHRYTIAITISDLLISQSFLLS